MEYKKASLGFDRRDVSFRKRQRTEQFEYLQEGDKNLFTDPPLISKWLSSLKNDYLSYSMPQRVRALFDTS